MDFLFQRCRTNWKENCIVYTGLKHTKVLWKTDDRIFNMYYHLFSKSGDWLVSSLSANSKKIKEVILAKKVQKTSEG